MYKKRKRDLKTAVIEALLFILCQLLGTSSNEDACGRGFLHFSEAVGPYSSNFEHPVEKQEFNSCLKNMISVCLLLLSKVPGILPFSINVALH